MGLQGLTPFEREVIDSIHWQLEGHCSGRVSRRATTRILRATLRRIKPRLAARSIHLPATLPKRAGRDIALDHAIPLAVLVDELLSLGAASREALENAIISRLVLVAITKNEHDIVLRKAGLSKSMPSAWDGRDPFARYRAAGIEIELY